MPSTYRTIIHVDMDEFFAAVEKLDNPALVGKAILVGGDPKGRGVVATASYEAREFGCHSAMPMAKAMRLCPHAIIVHPHFGRYEAVSGDIFEVFHQFTPLVEGLSIDEAFLDVSGCGALFGPGPQIAAAIKHRIRERTGLTASVGVAPNKFLAKLASDLKKPDGLVVVPDDPAKIRELLDPLSVRKIFGIGPMAQKQLAKLNIHTIGELRRVSPELLRRCVGPQAAQQYMELAGGIDDRPVEPGGQAKSIGQEETFAVDVTDLEELRRVLLSQVEHVARRLREDALFARTVTLKIRYGDFTTITRSKTLPDATDLTADLWETASALIDEWSAESFRPLRLLGVHVSGLCGERGRQMSLFEDPAPSQKQQRLDETLDDIARKFGKRAVKRGPGQR